MPFNETYTKYLSPSNYKIEISDSCLERFPCIHDVILNGKKTKLGGVEIYKLFKNHKIEVPAHFKEYK